jgi:hypothetical protein
MLDSKYFLQKEIAKICGVSMSLIYSVQSGKHRLINRNKDLVSPATNILVKCYTCGARLTELPCVACSVRFKIKTSGKQYSTSKKLVHNTKEDVTPEELKRLNDMKKYKAAHHGANYPSEFLVYPEDSEIEE